MTSLSVAATASKNQMDFINDWKSLQNAESFRVHQ